MTLELDIVRATERVRASQAGHRKQLMLNAKKTLVLLDLYSWDFNNHQKQSEENTSAS
jgi:hypothetical protein